MDFQLIVNYFTMSEYDPTRPTLEKILVGNIVLIILFILIIVAVEVGKYAMGLKIFGKKKAIKTIIPVYGLMLLFRAVDLNPWLAIAAYVPIVGIIPFSLFSFYVPKAFGLKIDYQLLSILCPFIIFNMLGFDKKYEYQYVKGKNIAFKDEFRTVMPEDLAGDALTPASAVNGAAVTMIAKESMISRAASAAAEQTRLIREEQEKREAEEAKKKADEEAAKKASRQRPEDYNYDIFNGDEKNTGPDSASLGINFNMVNGRFQSASAAPASKPVAPTPVAPAPAPAPTLEIPAAQAPAAPAPEPVSVSEPVAPAPVAPAPAPVAPVAPAAPVATPAPAPTSAPEPTVPQPVTPTPQQPQQPQTSTINQ